MPGLAHIKKYIWIKDKQEEKYFCKTIYSFHKTGHKREQQTNNYILFTNVSLKPSSSGGKSSNQTSTLQKQEERDEKCCVSKVSERTEILSEAKKEM